MSGDDSSTVIVLDDSTESSTSSVQEVFQPVKPGGQKLDDTIDLDETSEDEAEVQRTAAQPVEAENGDYDESSQYVTSASQLLDTPLPGQGRHLHSLLPEDSFRGMQPTLNSTPRPTAAANTTATLLVPEATKDPFDVEDEFLNDALDNDKTKSATVEMAMQASFVKSVTGTAQKPAVNVAASPFPESKSKHIEKEKAIEAEEKLSPELADSAICSPTSSGREYTPSPKKEVEKQQKDDRTCITDKLPKTCTVLKGSNGGTLYLVGTAHYSEESQKDVSRVMQLLQPHAIVLELCKARSGMLYYDEKSLLEETKEVDLKQMLDKVREDGAIQGVINFLMHTMAANLTRKLGMAPGGEFRAGYREAKKIPGCQVSLGDRPIGITLNRAVNSLSLWQKVKFAYNLLCSNEDFSKEDIERMKEKDILEQLMQDLAGEFPILSEVLVRERDLYLAYSLRKSLENPMRAMIEGEDPIIVGVVGLGHVQGIVQNWESVSARDVAKISVIPRPPMSERLLRLGLKYSFYALLAYGGYRAFRGPVTRLWGTM